MPCSPSLRRVPDLSIHWTPNEIALFERGYARHNKQFRKIAQMINGKSTKSVVRYYYHWKNTRRTDKVRYRRRSAPIAHRPLQSLLQVSGTFE